MLLRTQHTEKYHVFRLSLHWQSLRHLECQRTNFAAMSKSTKNRKQRSTNMSRVLLKELQATIAFACFDSPSLIQRGTSLSEAAIEDVLSSIYYGDDKNGALDPDMITYVDQFMLGLKKFKGLYTRSLQAGSNGASGEVLLSIPEFLHRHKNFLVFVGSGSIEKAILSQKSVALSSEKVSGRTLVRMSKTVVCNCKKMMAIVKAKGSPYRDGEFPSGTNWEDYILWCLVAMGKECDREDAAKIDSVAKKANGLCGLVGIEDEEGQSEGVLLTNLSSDSLLSSGDRESNNYADATFFKCGVGFLAWALWGFIPIHDSAGMQSDVFGDAKINASVGRRTTSRAQMRKLLMDQNAATLDNRRRRKRRAADDENQQQSNNQQPADPAPLPRSSVDAKAILAKTLMYLNADSLKRERQRNAQMIIRNIRDKLISRRRNEDSIGQELDRCHRSKRKPDQALLDRKNVIANEIASLEMKLDTLQSDKYRRHSDMINERAMELAAASSSDATISSAAESNYESATDSVVADEDVVICNHSDDVTTTTPSLSQFRATTTDVLSAIHLQITCVESARNAFAHCVVPRRGHSKMLGGATCASTHKVSRTNN